MLTDTFLPSNSVQILNKGTAIKQGDTKTVFVVKLLNEEGQPVDLTGTSVDIYFSKLPENALLFSKQATPATPLSDGNVSFNFDENDVTGVGQIRLQFNVTYEDNRIEKFPADDYAVIMVNPSLDNLENVQISSMTIDQMRDSLTTSFSTSIEMVKNQLTNEQDTYETNLNSQFNTHKTEVQNDVETIDERVTNLNKIYVSSSTPSDTSATLWVDTMVE